MSAIASGFTWHFLLLIDFAIDCVAELCYDTSMNTRMKRGRVDMKNTYARPVRDLRNNYSEIISLVNAGNQVIITKNGREAAVVIGTEAYKEFELFLHRRYINQALAEAKKKAKDPETKWISEDEFWAEDEEVL